MEMMYENEKEIFWYRHVTQWQKSGIKIRKYCREQGLNVYSFSYWRKKFKSKNNSISFVQLPNLNSFEQIKNINSFNAIKVVISNNIKIEINDEFNPITLKKVIETLRSM